MSLIITQEDLDKAKLDLAKEVKALKKKYSFLNSHEVRSIVLREFASGKNPRKGLGTIDFLKSCQCDKNIYVEY